MSTLEQRLFSLDHQTHDVRDLRPLRKPLLAKRSKRCKHCQHILVKPELNPSSNKFKLHTMAVEQAPNITIATLPELHVGKPAKVGTGEHLCVKSFSSFETGVIAGIGARTTKFTNPSVTLNFASHFLSARDLC